MKQLVLVLTSLASMVNSAIAVFLSAAYSERGDMLVEPCMYRRRRMERLRQRDLNAFLRCLQDAYAIRDLDRFPGQVGFALERLIPNDYYVYAEVDGQTRKTVLATSYPAIETILPNFQEIFDRCGHENPLPAAHQTCAGALKISDFLSQRQFRRLALYSELFKPGGVNYQMSVVLPGKPGTLRGIVVNRGARDFSERERVLLDLLRPHLAQARRNAEILDLLRRALEVTGHGILRLHGEGRITFLGEGVAPLLSAYFQGPTPQDNRLPEALDGWAREQQGRFCKPSGELPATRPLVVDRGDKRLVVRFLYGGGAGQDDVLLLEEQHVQVSPASLTAIGLSPREAEVLSLVSQGRIVAEISQILTITTSTVEKHLENIYVKLDVHSRVAAIARAFDAQKRWK